MNGQRPSNEQHFSYETEASLTACSLIDCVRESYRSDPRKAEKLVRTIGQMVCDLIECSDPLSAIEAGHIRFIREYFNHSGNLMEMHGCLFQQLVAVGMSPSVAERATKKISRGLEQSLQKLSSTIEPRPEHKESCNEATGVRR